MHDERQKERKEQEASAKREELEMHKVKITQTIIYYFSCFCNKNTGAV